jgi:hypothetical protein
MGASAPNNRFEFRELLQRSEFKLSRVIPTETHLSVVEAVRA